MGKFIPPDWRDASAYSSKTEDWLLGPWAWAFLRRNPEYQKDYEHFSALPSYYAHGGKTSKWGARSTSYYDDVENRYCKHPILPGESAVEYVARTKDETPWFYSLEDHLMEKWGIMHIADPTNNNGYYCFGHAPEHPTRIEQKSEFNPMEPEPDNCYEITLRFDLRYAIDNQLEEARHILLSFREARQHLLEGEIVKQSRGVQPRNLPIYLRTYDAKNTGLTSMKIGKELYPSFDIKIAEKRVDDAFKSAKKLIQGGYKKLIVNYK